MNPKRYPFPFPLAIHDCLRGLTLLLCFILLGWTQGSAQDRSTLEAKRMEIFQSLEQVETTLTQTKAKKSRILSKINELELRIENKDYGTGTVDKVVPKAKPTAPTPPISPATVAPTLPPDVNADYTATYNDLLQQHVRTKILNRGQPNASPEDIQRQLREASYIKSLREYIDQNPVASLAPDSTLNFVSDEPITEEEPVASEQQYTPRSESVTTEAALKIEMRQLLNQAAALTDNEITLEADINQLKATVESINLDLDQAIRSSLTLQSTSPIGNNRTQAPSTPPADVPPTSFNNIDYKKGFLPWPIKDAEVVSRYGQQQHSSTFNVYVNNNGVDLESRSTQVLSIFTGDVLSITYDDKGLATIIIQHSTEVYSVYSKIGLASVEQGQKVNQGQLLGTASEQVAGLANLHFEIWKGQQSENPQHWLKNN